MSNATSNTSGADRPGPSTSVDDLVGELSGTVMSRHPGAAWIVVDDSFWIEDPEASPVDLVAVLAADCTVLYAHDAADGGPYDEPWAAATVRLLSRIADQAEHGLARAVRGQDRGQIFVPLTPWAERHLDEAIYEEPQGSAASADGGPVDAIDSLRNEAPSFVALVADGGDFAAMQRYATFAFPSYGAYVRRMQDVLRSLSAEGPVYVALFDPDEYAVYCADAGLDPDAPTSRSRYTAAVAATGTTLLYAGQRVDHLVTDLVAAVEMRLTWERASELIRRATASETEGGQSSDEVIARASHAVAGLLESLGAGRHHLVLSVPDGNDAPLVAVLHVDQDAEDNVRLGETDALVFYTLMAAGIATGSPAGLVARTDGSAHGTDRVRGWTMRNAWLQPLTAAEVFNAYCTDAQTGDLIPPEPGVVYCAGTDISPPGD
ncbi:hypothetical protein [Streptantibioticus ferralitis]|uniref:Uncharacterized protein n=1 Tax=Streptantibioticus ferralitis TaxID=236510 RepID=A0ABT5Z5M9_9ACTN|nr:hypothetical protein [Streptantibioticus ferralitis]MDF2258360.1 hypothetical protein [Streptantibioticus ferralitis]